MHYRTKHTMISQSLTLVLLVCYIFSFTLFHHPNEMPANLGKIILQRQDSNKSFVPNSTTNNNTSSDSIRILKSIAGLNFMQTNTDDTDKNTVIVELKTPHRL